MRPISLSKEHYAYTWPTETLRPVVEVNQLGLDYALLSNGRPKEDKLLEICLNFHSYLMKYLNMIIGGHLPKYNQKVNRDTANMLSYFIPRGREVNVVSLSQACRTLHLAFKQMNANEVYDVLNLCFLKSVEKYDPRYVEKMAAVVQAIQAHFPHSKELPVEKLNAYLDFDCARFCRVLVRRGHLAPAGSGKTAVFVKQAWPPPAKLFKSGPIGFTYFVQRWFKYFLQEFIDSRMSEIEAKEGVLQLDYRQHSKYEDAPQNMDRPIPHSDGAFVSADGKRWAADVELMDKDPELGQLTIDWIANTADPLFSRLDRAERSLLYMIYAKELTWVEISRVFRMPVSEVKHWHAEVVDYLKQLAAVAETGEFPESVPIVVAESEAFRDPEDDIWAELTEYCLLDNHEAEKWEWPLAA